MPKIVGPISACSDHVRVQGQRTGAPIVIRASLTNIFEDVFSGTAKAPDETYRLTRKLKAGETAYVNDFVENAETVEPEPAQGELGVITAAGHLHACAQCGAFGNGYPGAEVLVTLADGTALGRGIVDAESGAAHVSFDPPLIDGIDVFAEQRLCGLAGPRNACLTPDMPAHDDRRLPAPIVRGPLRECERAIWIEGIAAGAIVRVYRDGQQSSSACFPYSEAWYRLRRPLEQGEVIAVDQQMPDCELRSPASPEIPVDVPKRPNAPTLLGPFCKGTTRIGVDGLRYGARITLVQTSDRTPGTRRQAVQRGTIIADAEAWDTLCDVPLFDPLDRARGQFVFAYQSLCDLHSPPSDRGEVHLLRGNLTPPEIVGEIFECSRMLRVRGIHPGARIDVYMTSAQPPGVRRIASQYVYRRVEDISVAPALQLGREVFVRQTACRKKADSPRVAVRAAPPTRPWIEDCGSHLHVKGVTPGALVEVYKGTSFFKSARSGIGEVIVPLASPLPAGTKLKARQILCSATAAQFGDELVVRDDVEKRRLQIVPIGVDTHPNYSSERVCQLSGMEDPEGKPILNNCRDAGIVGTDLGIVVDHTTGDGKLYFFFGDTGVEGDRMLFPWPEGADCMARTDATAVGKSGPKLEFLYDRPGTDGLGAQSLLIVPKPFLIQGASQALFEVPTGGFSHAGKLYVFASTDRFHDAPITQNLGKDDNFMGRSILVSARSWRDKFHIVAGHHSISDRSRADPDPRRSEFKFINIAPWKVRNADIPHLPGNSATSTDGLLMVGSGRYRESRPCLAYVPLPDGRDPDFAEWRFLAGFGDRTDRAGPCGKPLWSAQQKDALFLWDDRNFFAGNPGVLGELSMTFLPSVQLFVVLYGGTKMRSAEFPWGPWSDPIDLYDFNRDHRKLDRAPNDPPDNRPQYLPNGGVYGPYIIPRFTEHDSVSGETTLYHALSITHPLYQVELMRTKVRPVCGYAERPCAAF